ncbi:MAG: 2'-5' RNA ligase family protein [Burkholderiales bacterium]|nr:2'-5' RNA ligase family protein [Burkholderiales bacterium]
MPPSSPPPASPSLSLTGQFPAPYRRQASLYLPDGDDRRRIEILRRRFNPAQAALIPAHVTLCREGEVADWEVLAARARDLRPIFVSLRFGPPVREGNLVFLPATGPVAQFDDLRAALLAGDRTPRRETPHITLVHPRNGTCNDEAFRAIRADFVPFTAVFTTIMLIEQRNGGVWRTWSKVSDVVGDVIGDEA